MANVLSQLEQDEAMARRLQVGQQCLTAHRLRSTYQRWSNHTRVLVLVREYEYFLSTRTRVRRKVIVLVLEYITKVIVLTITSHN